MKTPSPVKKRSVVIDGHKTSVSIEDGFWIPLKQIARRKDIGVNYLVSQINADRKHSNLCSAIRLYVLDDFRQLAAVPVAEAA